jgi:flagellar hook-basal body complex protein FliE
MDPLSAIRQFFDPQTRALPLPKPVAEPAESFPIPAAELRELTSEFKPLNLNESSAPRRPFETVLGGLVGEVNAKQSAASAAVNGLLSGQNVSLHQAVIAMEEASVSFQLMVEVRNKLLESYQELMRMQV